MAANRPTASNQGVQRKALMEALSALYLARQTGEIDEFMSYFAPDARMTVVGNPVLNPDSGMRIGREGIARYLVKVHGENNYLGYEIDHVIAEGDQVIVRWHVDMRLNLNGKEVRFDVLDHLRIRDNQIVEITQFFDTGLMALLKGRIKLA